MAQDVDGIPKIYNIANSNEIQLVRVQLVPILVREPMRCQGARNRFLIAALTPAKVVVWLCIVCGRTAAGPGSKKRHVWVVLRP
mgnify:CR=1 FL=1